MQNEFIWEYKGIVIWEYKRNLWYTIGKSEDIKGRLAFIRFRRKFEEGFEQKVIGEKQECEVMVVSSWLQMLVSVCC